MNVFQHLRILTFIFLFTIGASRLYFKIDWKKSNRRLIIKNGIECVLFISWFIFPVYGNFFATTTDLNSNVTSKIVIMPVIISVVLSIMALWQFAHQFLIYRKVNKPFDSQVLSSALVSLIVGILMSFSIINYAIYIISPSSYEIPANMSFVEVAFEFVYYSFTLAITYSSSSISATHVVTKIAQIIEICYSYIIIGCVLVQLIDKFKDYKNIEDEMI